MEEGIIRTVKPPTWRLRYPRAGWEAMEAVKSYRIPVGAPRDLIKEYFRIKQGALAFVIGYV